LDAKLQITKKSFELQTSRKARFRKTVNEMVLNRSNWPKPCTEEEDDADHGIKEDEVSGACSAHGGMKNADKILVGKPDGKRHSENLSVDERIILKCILGKYGWRVWIGLIWFRIGAGGGLF
jgi:hypothetical protein